MYLRVVRHLLWLVDCVVGFIAVLIADVVASDLGDKKEAAC
jgi:hypothetical protein